MEINIKMDKCRFFVDEEKRTVICVIEDTHNLVRNFFDLNYLWDETSSRQVRFEPYGKLSKFMFLPDRFVGKAVCAPEDEWNEEVGRLIAFNRAKMKLNTSFFKRAQEYVTEIDAAFNDMVTRVNEYGARLSRGADKRLEHIKRICPTFEEEEKNNEEH